MKLYLTLLLLLNIYQLINSRYITPNSINNKFCENDKSCLKSAYLNEPNNYDVSLNFYEKHQFLCEICDLLVPIAQKVIRENKTEHFQPIAIFFCKEFKIEDPVVCDLVVKEYEVKNFAYFN